MWGRGGRLAGKGAGAGGGVRWAGCERSESGAPRPPRWGQRPEWGKRDAVVTAGPKDPLWLPGLGRDPGARGGRGHSPRPHPNLPGPKQPGNQKTGLVTGEQKLYRTEDTIPDSRLLPRLSSFLAAALRRPHSSNTSRNPRLPASKMAPGYRLRSKTGRLKVPARRNREDSGRCSSSMRRYVRWRPGLMVTWQGRRSPRGPSFPRNAFL